MKPEARLWNVMREQMVLPGDRADRIENSISSGHPDVNGCFEAEDVWIELKAPTEPARAETPLLGCSRNHELLISQQGWFARQKQSKGIAFILIRTDKRLLLIDGTRYATTDKFNRYTVTQLDRIALFKAPVPTPQAQWRSLRNVIITASRYRRLHQHASAQQLLADMERNKAGVASDREPGRRPPVAPGKVAQGGSGRGSRGARGG